MSVHRCLWHGAQLCLECRDKMHMIAYRCTAGRAHGQIATYWKPVVLNNADDTDNADERGQR